MMKYYVGVDVGTGSVRAALVRHDGEMCNISTRDIKTWNPKRDYYEQSSNNIWKCCCEAVKDVTESIDPSMVMGIGFDTTCSLVVIGDDDGPLTVSPTGDRERNVILWMDHRAKYEADFINRHHPEILKYTGDSISLEMETPKLMWLKENMKDTWKKAKYFFDLADFMTWRATGDDSRSLCTVVCKWTFVNGTEEDKGWNKQYFALIGLEELLENNAIKIGRRVKAPGDKCGNGLLEEAAKELGLLPGTPVGCGIIDAHAGGLGLLGSSAPHIPSDLDARIGLICGTSTCHMIVSKNPVFVPGVWGPYYSAMVPNMWLNEAGQSATGKLLDFIIDTHPAKAMIIEKNGANVHIHKYLNRLLGEMASARGLKSLARLTSRLHVWPDFHGNRSPLADPNLLGMVSGLALTGDEEDLALKYLSTMQALVYGTRHILETLKAKGFERLSVVLICGGLSKNDVFVQSHADILGLPVLLPKATDPVLLGAAMLGSVAGGGYETVQDAVLSMAGDSVVYEPNKEEERYHSKKYETFLKMVEDQKQYDALMSEFLWPEHETRGNDSVFLS